MVEETKEQKVFTKTQFMITLILILFLSITGATYAYFAFSSTNNTTITGTAATVNLSLTVDKIFPLSDSDNTGMLVPQISISGDNDSPLSKALKSGCVDSNKNIVCQVYKITVGNSGGTVSQVVDGGVSFFGNTEMTQDIKEVMPSLKWKLITSVDKDTPTNSVLGTNLDIEASSNKDSFVNGLTMEVGSSYDYYMIVWIGETNEDQPTDQGNSFFGSVWFEATNGTGITSVFK